MDDTAPNQDPAGNPMTGTPTTGSPTTGSPTTGSPTTGSPVTVRSGRVVIELPAGEDVALLLDEADGGPLVLTAMACELIEVALTRRAAAEGVPAAGEQAAGVPAVGDDDGARADLGELELPDGAVVHIDGEVVDGQVALELLAESVVAALRAAVEQFDAETGHGEAAGA